MKLRINGWVNARESDRSELQSFGVQVGEYDPHHSCFVDCSIREDDLAKLADHEGRWYWFFPEKGARIVAD